MKKIIKVVVYFIIFIIIIFNLYFIYSKLVLKNDLPKIFGYSYSIVLSDSMYPTFKKGDLVVFKESDYKENDVIIFRYNNYYITHRIIGEENKEFVTKGDNNISVDSELVNLENIEGKLVMILPFLGTIINFITSIYGIIIILIIVVLSKYIKKYKALLILLLVPATGSYALFKTTLYGEDFAKVSNVHMNLNLFEGVNLSNMVPGEERIIAFTVHNYEDDFVSEVKQNYEIVVNKTDNILVGLNLEVLNPAGDTKYANELTIDNYKYTYKNGVLSTEKESHHYLLKIEVLQNRRNQLYYEEIDLITLEINSEQKNS